MSESGLVSRASPVQTALRTIVRLRKQDVDERKEQEAILETYMHALGMLA